MHPELKCAQIVCIGMTGIEKLMKLLSHTPPGNFFNPWYHRDPQNDCRIDAPNIRKAQLEAYLSDRVGQARYLLIAEALGYQGGHFSGIAMTSERILLGHHKKPNGLGPEHVFCSLKPERTSLVSIRENGMNEPTATIVWNTILSEGVDPYHVVHWNALAWHPYNPNKGLLSNRTPGIEEFRQGEHVLGEFLELFPSANVIAVGRKSAAALTRLGVISRSVPHPAYGGAPKFRAAMARFNTPDSSDDHIESPAGAGIAGLRT